MRTALLLALLAAAPAGANPLSDLIVGSEPCSGLSPIDRTETARLSQATIELDGDTVRLAATGHLRCKTSPGTWIGMDAAARINLSAEIDLTTCDIPVLSLDLDDFGGSAEQVLRLADGLLEDALRADARRELVDLCEGLKDPG
ncbi:hypothetical protein [Psychromarinibacter halotolerans]|uniref:Uncharacterized protein n=1 Tax=Psychromarinibacter halotolerans TaxID=1775175 RepID=A0ABV7GTX0_9RHOB|nr:hypothetical protein [Psychromarinibacter halotolerans]MDF0594819.1 hypothetical protein [Psychromarinibacter halotolerans]